MRRVQAIGTTIAWIAGLLGGAAVAADQPVAPLPHSPFYSKQLSCAGVPIRASADVADAALRRACDKVARMLARMPAARRNLLEWGAELHVIGRSDPTTSLPELRHFRAEAYVDAAGRSTDIDQRARGVGGVFAACSEENLLGLAGDRHRGADICTHEFAHTIMDIGLDPALRQAIHARYDAAMQGGLWHGAYASTNAREYWAELSMWYFGSHGDPPPDRVGMRPGPASLAGYDAGGYALLHSIYSGQTTPADAAVGDVEPAGADAGSGQGAGEARFIVLNAGNDPLVLSWVDDAGNPRGHYPAVNPFQPAVQNSLIDHVWLLTDRTGRVVERFRLRTTDSRLVVGPAPS